MGEPVVERNQKRQALELVLAATVVTVALIAGLFSLFGQGAKRAKTPPKVLGRREGCVVCHLPMRGFVKAHDPKAIGCASCHMGDPFTLDEAQAHKGMALVPGNLTQVRRTCGTSRCHPLLAKRITEALMASGRGLVAVDRFVFGEANSPNAVGSLSRLGSSAADDHLRKLCASCHLGKVKRDPSPVSSLSRGGGCTACHLQYSPRARGEFRIYKHKGKVPDVHPGLSINVSTEHCFGCHSRSGRISTNYEGWHETQRHVEEVKGNPAYRILKDGRVFVHAGADIHFERGMECIDCHTWRETMGDGKMHFHEEEQVEISCEDCHPLTQPRTITSEKLQEIDAKILRTRPTLKGLERFVVASKTGTPLLNVGLDNQGSIIVKGKNSGKTYHPKRPAHVCSTQIYGHQRLTCQSCHTPWAPSCIKCHTSYDRSGMGLDHITGKRVKGRWVEERGDLLARQPALGIRMNKGRPTVDTFIPGMILTIDLKEYRGKKGPLGPEIFRRLYAPTSAHTTSAKGLRCQACHINTVALGLGDGLFSIKKGSTGQHLDFQPLFQKRAEDGLPRDAWCGFLTNREKMSSTRVGARPLNREEQVKVLRVGVCLNCHPANANGIEKIYGDFSAALMRLSPRCILPDPLIFRSKKVGKRSSPLS